MKKVYELFDKENFHNIYNAMNNDKDLLDTLIDMQNMTNVTRRKAYEVADEVICEVAKFEYTKEMTMSEPVEVFREFLDNSNKWSRFDRESLFHKILLHKIRFGLALYQDPDLVAKLKEGAGVNDLFNDYFKVHGEDPSITAADLEAAILEQVKCFHVSPAALRTMAHRLETSDNILFTAAALSADNMRFKCVMAMDYYLRNRKTVTVAQSVSTICTNIDVQAAADAYNRGKVTADTFRKIISGVASAGVLIGLAAVIASAFGVTVANVALADVGCNLLFGGTILDFVSNALYNPIGKLIADIDLFWQRDNSAVVESLKALARIDESEQAPADTLILEDDSNVGVDLYQSEAEAAVVF